MPFDLWSNPIARNAILGTGVGALSGALFAHNKKIRSALAGGLLGGLGGAGLGALSGSINKTVLPEKTPNPTPAAVPLTTKTDAPSIGAGPYLGAAAVTGLPGGYLLDRSHAAHAYDPQRLSWANKAFGGPASEVGVGAGLRPGHTLTGKQIEDLWRHFQVGGNAQPMSMEYGSGPGSFARNFSRKDYMDAIDQAIAEGRAANTNSDLIRRIAGYGGSSLLGPATLGTMNQALSHQGAKQ